MVLYMCAVCMDPWFTGNDHRAMNEDWQGFAAFLHGPVRPQVSLWIKTLREKGEADMEKVHTETS